jgi:hypothetical protein
MAQQWIDGRLDNGLEGNKGRGNQQQLSLADSCLLMATDGSNNSSAAMAA